MPPMKIATENFNIIRPRLFSVPAILPQQAQICATLAAAPAQAISPPRITSEATGAPGSIDFVESTYEV
jgi:hypothetical protein